jgi:TPR repeat protein
VTALEQLLAGLIDEARAADKPEHAARLYRLGSILLEAAVDPESALRRGEELLREAGRLGHAGASYGAAVLAIHKGQGAEPAEGVALLRAAAEQGSPWAAYEYGRMCLAFESRAAEGVRWLETAARGGIAEACYQLGLAYGQGRGAPANPVASRRMHAIAAEEGNAEAQFELSLMLAQGLGGAVDPDGALRWEEKAAEADHPRACLNRGARAGRGGDDALALEWYHRAARAGSAEAAARLAVMFAGNGVAPSREASRYWYLRASELGFDWKSVEGEWTERE